MTATQGTDGPGDAGSPAGPGKKPASWSLPLRVASGVLFVPLLIALARAGGISFLAFVALQVLLAQTEFYRMARHRGVQPTLWLGLLTSLGVLWVAFQPQVSQADFLATATLLLALGLALRHPQLPRRVEGVAVTLFGVMYVGWLSAHLVLLRELPWRAGTDYALGESFVLLAFLVTWSCDTGAYVIGQAFGRRRPWARISPRKSLEGAAGGLVCATAAAVLARSWFAPYLRPWDAIAIGVLVGMFAQVGDLVESLFKRDAQHGDSSDIIPGHGGVLDRVDSLYFGAPIVFYYLKIVVFQVP